MTPEPPDAGPLRSDRRPESPLREGPPGQDPAVPARSPVPLRRKRPAGTRGSGDIDKPSAVTERACSIGDHALSEIDAPGPHLTPACGGRLRRPRTEEWTLPDHHPRSRRQLGALDPRSPITEEGTTTGLSLLWNESSRRPGASQRRPVSKWAVPVDVGHRPCRSRGSGFTPHQCIADATYPWTTAGAIADGKVPKRAAPGASTASPTSHGLAPVR